MPRVSTVQRIYNLSASGKLSDALEIIEALKKLKRKKLGRQDIATLRESIRRAKIKLLSHNREQEFLELVKLENEVLKIKK